MNFLILFVGAPSTFISQNSACQFVLQCLLRIPTKICVDLADDLLLSPLGQVVGSTKFKQVLVQLCSSVKELNHLSELGCLLGIQEWTNHMSQKCVLPESSIQKISPDSEELFNKESQEKVNSLFQALHLPKGYATGKIVKIHKPLL